VNWFKGVARALTSGTTSSQECYPPRFAPDRDVKPSNVLIDTHFRPKLCDFGLAKFVDRGRGGKHTFVGTPSFIAPEVIAQNEGAADAFTSKADVYRYAPAVHPNQCTTALCVVNLV
jgi:serine/threonine protein kinase